MKNRKDPVPVIKTSLSVVSAEHARANFGRWLRRVTHECRSVLIENRGTPEALLLSIQNYVRLAAPEPKALRIIGEESQRNGTNQLTLRAINRIIQNTRVALRPKR